MVATILICVIWVLLIVAFYLFGYYNALYWVLKVFKFNERSKNERNK